MSRRNTKALGARSAGGGYRPETVFSGLDGGEVLDADQGLVGVDALPSGRRATITTATLLQVADGTTKPVSTDVDLKLVTLESNGFTERATLISGDGQTLYDTVSGDPLGAYRNISPDKETVGVVVENQSGLAESVFASFEGTR